MVEASSIAHPVPILRGERIALRVWRREDAPALFENFSDPKFMRNERSCRLVERLGFQREGLLRQRWYVNGEIADSVLHGLLKTDPR